MAMTAYQLNEQNITSLLQLIEEVSSSVQPDFSVQGRSISRGAYLIQLNEALDAAIARRQKLSGPFMVKSYVR